MTRYAIDPGTLVEIAERGRSVRPGHQLVAPNSIRSLALDLLLLRVRSGELGESQALKLHERMTELKMRLLGDRVSRRTAWRIALDHGLTTIRDAEYLAVAKLQSDALVTVSVELAALAEGMVPLAACDELLVL